MNPNENMAAFGAPGIEPRWTSSAKEGIGTSYHTNCKTWFTLSHGIINEIYYPTVDQPNTRDFQFLITDGKTFCHEEKRDLKHQLEYPQKDCLLYRLINSDPQGRYRLIKEVITDPHRSVVLVHTKLEITDESLKGKLKIYALLAPHLGRQGRGNSGCGWEMSGLKLLRAERGETHLVMGCSAGFSRTSVGYVGASDGWRDLMDNFQMDWEFARAENGNIALTGEIDLQGRDEFVIGVAFGRGFQSTGVHLLQSLAESFETHRDSYVRQWHRTVVNPKFDFSKTTTDGGHQYRVSRCVLLVHEDKSFEGALVASMSIPWGETKDDQDMGGYHLVWTRDLVQSATALLASGQTGTPLRALIWLAAVQRPDGCFPQNSWIDGNAYWSGQQLDEVAAPILLAWRLHREGVPFGQFDPSVMIFRAASFLIRQGPVTGQERWEENSGYSPSTLATVIAGLVCAAEFVKRHGEKESASFIVEYADWIAAHLEDWTVTTQGEIVTGLPRHYIRINPTSAQSPDPHADPNETLLLVGNSGGTHPAKDIVGGDFLQLVRLGLRSADDPIVRDSVKVLDRVLKQDLPQGPAWRRYNHDGYGQKDNGEAFDGTGVGRCWPILTGERGHYELAAGRTPKPYITAIEKFANEGGMITEQLWDEPDITEKELKLGQPTGAAMPLCWSHAEYISLVRSAHDGVCFDRVEPAYQRYVAKPIKSFYEMWSVRYAIRHMRFGQTLRLILGEEVTVVWTPDAWKSTLTAKAHLVPGLHLWFVDLPTKDYKAGSVIEFTFFWEEAKNWEGKNYSVTVSKLQ
jgi:glucoamylase